MVSVDDGERSTSSARIIFTLESHRVEGTQLRTLEFIYRLTYGE